jgi:hypothetical protein
VTKNKLLLYWFFTLTALLIRSRRGIFDGVPPELAPYLDYIYIALAVGAAIYAQQSASAIEKTTSGFSTVSADKVPDTPTGYDGVLEKWNRNINTYFAKEQKAEEAVEAVKK